MGRFPFQPVGWTFALATLVAVTAACFLVDENDNPQAVGQCAERAGARAEYPPADAYGGSAKGVLVARFAQGSAVLMFAGRGEQPTPPAGRAVTRAVDGRVAYWWQTPAGPAEAAALHRCLTTAHS